MSALRLSPQWKRRVARITLVAVVVELFVLPLWPNSPSAVLAAEAINDGGAAGSANYYQQELEKFGKGIDHVGPSGVMTYPYPMCPITAVQTKTRDVNDQWRAANIWRYVDVNAADHATVQVTSAISRSPNNSFDRPDTPPIEDVQVTRSWLDAQQCRVTDTTNFKGDLRRGVVKHWITTAIDEENHATITTRDPGNQRTTITDAKGGVTTYATAFDHESITDADNCATHRWFNWAGELLALDDPDLGTWTNYAYDLNGNLLLFLQGLVDGFIVETSEVSETSEVFHPSAKT